MQVNDKEMDLKQKEALVEWELQDVQIFLMLMCPTLGPEPTRERF